MSDTAKPSLHDNDALLTYRVGPVLCCGPTLPVVTIIPPPALTQLPGTNIAEPGIFKHGTYVVSATDLRHRFGVKQENWNQPAKVIIAQHDDLNLTRGYFVDEIKDVISFPEKGWGKLPTHLPRGVFSRTLLLDGHIYLYTEFVKLSQLQGTGYLADYIVHLEKLEEENKQTATKPSAKTSIEKQTTSTLKKSEKQNIINDNKINTPEIRSSEIKSASISSSNKDETSSPIIEEVTPKIEVSAVPNTTNNETPTSLPNNSIIKSNQSALKVTEKTLGAVDKLKTKKPTVTSQPTSSKLKVNIESQDITDKTKPIENTRIKNKTVSSHSLVTKESNIKSVKEFLSDNCHNDKLITSNKRASPDTSKDESNIFPIFIIMLFLILIVAVVYFTLKYTPGYSSDDSVVYPTKEDDISLSQTYEDTSTTIDNKINTISDSDITPKNESQTSKETITNESIDKAESNETEPDKSSIDIAPLNSSKEESILTTGDTENEYHATIQQDNDTITIELDGPLPPKINNTDKISIEDTNPNDSSVSSEVENKTQHPSDEISITVESPESKKINTKTASTPQKNQQDTSSFEIVHIIVKGDTLWAIAKHYLLNPYRYPELAKLSKIHNPDLIYPGKRVRIIYKKSLKN